MRAAIKSLAYRPYERSPEETKQGFVYYNGNSQDWHFWNFKTMLKMKTTSVDQFPEAVSRLVESLRGDALTIAMEIGVDTLIKEDRTGIYALITKMREHVFPILKDEVKTLYKEGHRESGGVLSRQRGEPMKNYIQRRERWYTTLITLDDTFTMNDELKGELMLTNAGISELDRKLILTITGNKTSTEAVKDALMLHHAQTHLRQRQDQRPQWGNRERRSNFNNKRYHKKDKFRKGAYVVDGYNLDYEGEDRPAEYDNDPASSESSEASYEDDEPAGDAFAATRG